MAALRAAVIVERVARVVDRKVRPAEPCPAGAIHGLHLHAYSFRITQASGGGRPGRGCAAFLCRIADGDHDDSCAPLVVGQSKQMLRRDEALPMLRRKARLLMNLGVEFEIRDLFNGVSAVSRGTLEVLEVTLVSYV